MLVSFNFLLKEAIRNNFDIGIIEVWDLNTIKAAVEARAFRLAINAVIKGIDLKHQPGTHDKPKQ